MCRPLHYLLLQPCASDAQTAAAKWVIQPWGSPALPLSLYPPLPQSPLVPLSLLPSSIQSLPLHPSSPFPTVPLDFSSHMLFFTYWPNPPVWVSAFVFLSLSHKILLLFHYSHLPSFSVALSFSQSLLYLPSFFNFYQINKNGCFRWKNPDAVRK